MRISELSRRSGVPASTLRYYESVGLIEPARGVNGYRDFAEEAVQRLTFIQAAKHLDLSLPEIADLLGVVEAQTCSQVRDTLRPKLDQRLQEVEQRLAALVQLRDRLTQARDRVGACPDSGRRCRSECAMTPTPRQCRHDHATTGNLP